MELDSGNLSGAGESALLSGTITVEAGEVDPDALRLAVDGEAVEAEFSEDADGALRFSAQVDIPAETDAPVEIALRSADGETTYATQTWSSPAATPAPLPVLRLVLERPVERTEDGARLRGSIFANMPVDWENAALYVNDELWPMQFEGAASSLRCAFTAEGSVEDVQVLQVRVVYGAGEDEATARASAPLATPEPAPVLTLAVETESVPARVGEVVVRGTLLVEGNADPQSLEMLFNGNRAATEWEAVDGGYAFTTHLEMDLTEAEALEVLARATGAGEIARAETTVPVLAPEADPTPQANAAQFAPIALENAETLEDIWLGAGEMLLVRGTAQPNEALAVSLNGHVFGNFVIDEEGNFAVDIAPSSLDEGENAVDIAYSGKGDASQPIALTVHVDSAPPQLTLQSAVVDQHATEIAVRVSGEEMPCEVALLVDGQRVSSAETNREDALTILSLGEVELSEQSAIEVEAIDRAGNRSAQSVAFERTAVAIEVEGQEARDVYGPETPLEIALEAEPDALLDVACGGRTWTVPTGGSGDALSLTLDFAAGTLCGQDGEAMPAEGELNLQEGENALHISYRTVGGVAMEEAPEAQVSFRFDSVAPQLSVTPTTLLPGERELQLSVAGEAEGWSCALAMDGETVWSSDGFVEAESATVTLPEELALSEGTELRVEARDRAGNRANQSVFVEELAPIVIADKAQYAHPLGADEPVRLRVVARAGAELEININGRDYGTPVAEETSVQGTEETYIFDITAHTKEGENTVAVRYADSNGYPTEATNGTQASLTLRRDLTAPQFTLSPQIITGDTAQLDVRVSNEDDYQLQLWVDGVAVYTAENSAVIPIAPELGLTKDSDVSVIVRDAAGNSAEQALEVQMVAPIVVEERETFNAPFGAEDAIELTITSEPGVDLEIEIQGKVYRMEDNAGRGRYTLTSYIPEGENDVVIRYAADNGYLPEVIAQTQTSLTIARDTTPPQLSVEPARITRDTSALEIGVSNEESGYELELFVDDALVWAGSNAVSVPITEDYALTEDSSILLCATDASGNKSTTRLHYEDTSIYVEAAASSPQDDFGTVAPGARLETDILLLCNARDYSARCRVYLENEAGKKRCDRESAPAEDAQRVEALYESGNVNRNYADAAYVISAITIPGDCASGEYRLTIELQTESETHRFEIGTVTVGAQQTSSIVSESYVDLAAQYAIGFDELLQDSFRPDNIVLTGWVSRPEGVVPYFASYELIDSAGRPVIGATGYFDLQSGEFRQFDRVDVGEKVSGIAAASQQDAGFILDLDLSASGARLTDGETYTLQLYTSSETGVSLQTIRATFRIDSGAEPVANAVIENMIESLTPPPEVEESVPEEGAETQS